MNKSNPITATIVAAAIFTVFQSPVAMAQGADWQFNGALIIKADEDQQTVFVPVKADFLTEEKCKGFPANFARNVSTTASASTGSESSELYEYFRANARTVLYGACTNK